MPLCHSKYTHLPYESKLTERAALLRKNMTLPEQKIWFQFLRKDPLRFTRQKPIDCYIVDFYCASLKLVIEIDGNSHFEDEAKRYDGARTLRLEGYGLRVVRFTNIEILTQFEGVCETLSKIFLKEDFI